MPRTNFPKGRRSTQTGNVGGRGRGARPGLFVRGPRDRTVAPGPTEGRAKTRRAQLRRISLVPGPPCSGLGLRRAGGGDSAPRAARKKAGRCEPKRAMWAAVVGARGPAFLRAALGTESSPRGPRRGKPKHGGPGTAESRSCRAPLVLALASVGHGMMILSLGPRAKNLDFFGRPWSGREVPSSGARDLAPRGPKTGTEPGRTLPRTNFPTDRGGL